MKSQTTLLLVKLSFTRSSLAPCLVALILFVQNATAQLPLPFHEPFPDSYGENVQLGNGETATIWTHGNSPGNGSATVTSAAALNYSGLAAGSGYGVLSTAAPTSNRDRGVRIVTQTLGEANPTVYVSFLLNIQTPPASERLLAAFRSGTAGGGGFNPIALGIFVNASLQVAGCINNTNADSAVTGSLNSGTTHLVVARYQWVSDASNDVVNLWVNPASLGATEGGAPAPNLSITNTGADPLTLDSFHFPMRTTASGQNGGGTYWLDELRIGNTWASVTPTEGGGGGQVNLNVVNNQNGTITISFIGTPDTQHYLESTTSLAAPILWDALNDSLSTVAGDGSWAYTTAISGTPRYFRSIRVP